MDVVDDVRYLKHYILVVLDFPCSYDKAWRLTMK
jgi:hypothetical protein